jgi:hypothetical protein
MSYEATISSYGGNTTVMVKSFVLAVRSVAQTWYSSLLLGKISSWQNLKDMLVTIFQGFQTKQVTAQKLFQCMQDHEEYLQAYVQRFLRLRAQASVVPNGIVIEAMIKGLWPRPTVQYCNTQFVIYNKRGEKSFPIFYVCVESIYHHM